MMVVASVVAAPIAQAELRLGIKAGANVSNFITNEKVNFENASLANFTGGAMLEMAGQTM